MHGHERSQSHLHTSGDTFHWARSYDWMLRLVSFGGEGRFRQRIVKAANVREGDRVLDVGCGTGTLALAAAQAAGATGRVEGIDPGPEMIDRARSKAAHANASVDFQVAAIEDLPYEDDQFDVVLSSLMFHHLTGPLQQRGLAEVRRVLAPCGRLCIVDFNAGDAFLHRVASHILSHGDEEEPRSGLDKLVDTARELGFEHVELSVFRPRVFHCLRADVPARD